MTATLQAFLFCKPSLSFSSSKRFHLPRSASSSCLSFNPLSLSTFTFSTFHKSRFCHRTLYVRCTLRPESAGFDSQKLNLSDTNSPSDAKDSNFKDFDYESSSNGSISEFGNSNTDECGGVGSEMELKSELGEVGLENEGLGNEANSEKVGPSEGKDENLPETEGKGGILSANEMKSRIPLVVFLMGMWLRVKKGFEKVLQWDLLSWWPFGRQEKRLERLIAEADANPKDVAKQNALLAELNKHRLGESRT